MLIVMRKIVTVVGLLTYVWTLSCQSISSAAAPNTLSLARLRAGLDTYFKARQLYGKGLSVTGEHYKGALIWRSRQTGWYLFVDGFDYRFVNHASYAIINQITLGKTSAYGPLPQIPTTSLPKSSCFIDRQITIGTSEVRVLAQLHRDHVTYSRNDNTISWSSKGLVYIDEYTQYTIWTVELDFDNRGLVNYITLYC
jgi:hypothetical protein